MSLRAAFDARVLSVLPLPVYADSHTSLLDQLQTVAYRVARFFQRFSTPQAGVRERALEVVASTSASAKLAAGIAGIVLLAAGAVGAATSRQPTHHHTPRRSTAVRSTMVKPTTPVGHTVPRKRPASRPPRPHPVRRTRQ